MSGKERFIKTIAAKHPEASKEMLELAWHLHNFDKAKMYSEILGCCNSYADIASKAIRKMLAVCDIDAQKAVNAAFIRALFPFTNLEKKGVPHSVVYHVKKILEDKDVLAERQAHKKLQQMNNEVPIVRTIKQSHYLLVAEGADVEKLIKLRQMAAGLGITATVSEVIIPIKKGDMAKHYSLDTLHKLQRRSGIQRNNQIRIQFLPNHSETGRLIKVPTLPLSTEKSLLDVLKSKLQISLTPYKYSKRMRHYSETVILKEISTTKR